MRSKNKAPSLHVTHPLVFAGTGPGAAGIHRAEKDAQPEMGPPAPHREPSQKRPRCVCVCAPQGRVFHPSSVAPAVEGSTLRADPYGAALAGKPAVVSFVLLSDDGPLREDKVADQVWVTRNATYSKAAPSPNASLPICPAFTYTPAAPLVGQMHCRAFHCLARVWLCGEGLIGCSLAGRWSRISSPREVTSPTTTPSPTPQPRKPALCSKRSTFHECPRNLATSRSLAWLVGVVPHHLSL